MSESWKEKYERERKEKAAKDKEAWEKYRADATRKPVSKERWATKGAGAAERFTDYVYDEGTKETATAITSKTTEFRVWDNGEVSMSKHSKKRQKFLCVNGPLAGKRITDDRDSDYLIYNVAHRSNRRLRTDAKAPTAVLVHRSAFEAKS